MKYMNYKDWLYAVISLALAVVFGYALDVLLTQLHMLDTEQSNTIVYSVYAVILSYMIGTELCSRVVQNVRKRRIAQEIEMEMAFREMGNK